MHSKKKPVLPRVVLANAFSHDKYFFLFGIFCCHVSYSQNTFQKTFHGTSTSAASDAKGFSVQQTPDSGYVIVGYTNSFGAGKEDVYLIKTDINGDTLWTKTYGGSESDYGYAIYQTADSGYIITGLTFSFGAGGRDVFLIRTNSTGDTLWTKTYGGTGQDVGYGVQQTSDNGYLIAGYTSSFGAGNDDVYLIKTNSTGDTLWTRTFGGTSFDQGYFAQETFKGEYIVTGYTNSFGTGLDDFYLLKTKSNGDLIWSKTFGGTGYDDPFFLQQTTDSGYIITGFTGSFGAGGDDFYLVKTDSAGNLQWSKTIGGTNYDDAYCVKQTKDGGYVIAGSTQISSSNEDVYVVKTDLAGNVQWSELFGGTNLDFGYSVDQTAGGGYIITGSSQSFGPWGETLYLIATDSAGRSGCNQKNFQSIVSNSATVVNIPATQISFGGIIKGAAVKISHGGIPNINCPSVVSAEGSTATERVLLFPNPGNGLFQLNSDIDKKCDLEIYNMLGQKTYSISQKIISSEPFFVNLSTQPKGIYLVKITSEEKNIYTEKLIIE